MSLSDRLAQLADAGTNTPQVTTPAPAGWSPGVVYQPDGSRIVTSGPIAETDDPTPVLAAMGVTVPPGFRPRLAEVRHDPAAWTRAAQGEDAVTTAVVRCRWVIEPAPASIDVDELFKAIKARKKTPAETATDATWAFLLADTQWGKVDGDGSAGTAARYYATLDRAVDRYKLLRKRGQVGPVLLLIGGDCIEGTEASNPLTRVDLTVTEMVRVYRRTLADAVQAFAELSDRVHVAVVPGNHDDAKRLGKGPAFRYDDSWAIEGASQVADVMHAKGYDIAWTFPDPDRMHLTIDASGTRIGLLHGHQTRGKMQNWLANKALSRDPIGTADIVCSGHYHHLRMEQYGPTTWLQTGAQDGGSVWWENIGGLSSPPAAVTFVTQDGKWNGLEIV